MGGGVEDMIKYTSHYSAKDRCNLHLSFIGDKVEITMINVYKN